MPRRFTGPSLGRSLDNDRKKRAEQERFVRATGVAEGQGGKSVLEQNSLDDFIATAELAQTTFEALRGHAHVFEAEGPRLVSAGPGAALDLAERRETARRIKVPIPWRPEWNKSMSAEELAALEGEAFVEWRRGLAQLEEQADLVMTPYERNLEFWRQLWRCVERSDLLVQILDARDPEFYRCQDLERYVAKFPGKRHLLLINKADFLTPELRQRWAEHFLAIGTDALFFSALWELRRQQRLPGVGAQDSGETTGELPPHGQLTGEELDVADTQRLLEELRSRLPPEVSAESGRQGTVGFVGYPNVGKSSVINALFGAKKVSMSRTPGKTKHLQTLELTGAGITLCDCPGLVFPSVVATKAHLAINGTIPLDELRDNIAPVRLIIEKIGAATIMEKYGLSAAAMRDGAVRRGEARDPANALLSGFATARQHFLRLGVPDETWAARKVLRDFCTGELLHCEWPPGCQPPPRAQAGGSSGSGATPGADAEEGEEEGGSGGSDFEDLDTFLGGADSKRGTHERQMTKRQARLLNKRAMKGGSSVALGAGTALNVSGALVRGRVAAGAGGAR